MKRYYIFFDDCGMGWSKEDFTCMANSKEEALEKFFDSVDVGQTNRDLFIATEDADYGRKYDKWLRDEEDYRIVGARPIQL